MPFIPNDPLYDQQLHFYTIGLIDGQRAIERIWEDYHGEGIYVMVYDTGVDLVHEDLDAQFDHTRDVEIGGIVFDGGNPTDGHGTGVAGLIGAESNGVGVVGVAFEAELVSYTDGVQQPYRYDVANMSFRFGYYSEPFGDFSTWEESTTGRGGLGTVMVKATGNEHIMAAADAANNLRYNIAVSATETAIGNEGKFFSFSNYGAAVLVAAPGEELTTDLSGDAGGNTNPGSAGDYHPSGGTSFSAPVVSGIVALMLDANPNLGWRDVQDILAASSVRSGSAMLAGPEGSETSTWVFNNATTWNGGGYHVSNDYGYGQVNVFNAVRMAEAYALIGRTAETSDNEELTSSATSFGSGTGFDIQLAISGDLDIDQVSVDLHIVDSRFDLLTISLTSPSGHTVVLHDGATAGSAEDILSQQQAAADGISWTYLAQAYRGETSQGTWLLSVEDADGGDAVVNSAKINIYGSTPDEDDVYVYTDEFVEMRDVAFQSGRAVFSDASGDNWFNGASLVRNLVLNMNAFSVSTYDGDAFITTSAGARMVNAIAGDGNDMISGNGLANQIHGMRGNDSIFGGAGLDELFGGDGDDWIHLAAGDAAGETYDGGEGIDTLALSGANYVISVRDAFYDSIDHIVFGDPGAGKSATLRMLASQTFGDGWYLSEVVGTARTDILDIAMGDETSLDLSVLFLTNFTNPGDFVKIAGDGSAEAIVGSAVEDIITGAAGADTMTGGGDADRFDFNAVAEIGMAQNARDVIVDFQQGVDKIDLDGIDALSTLAGLQHFTWLGTAAHTGAGATLRFAQSGSNTLVYGDTNANGGADFTLQLNGLFALTAADFTNLSIGTIQGGTGSDTLTGAPGGKTMLGLDGNDTIGGGAGADTILGGAGVDQLTGGLGADQFRWNAPSHTGVNAGTRDIVTDFQQNLDRLDLSAIDALTTAAGNQAFVFLGTAGHTGAGATLRYQFSGGNTIVYGDVNADGAGDFAIQLAGLYALTAADFVL